MRSDVEIVADRGAVFHGENREPRDGLGEGHSNIGERLVNAARPEKATYKKSMNSALREMPEPNPYFIVLKGKVFLVEIREISTYLYLTYTII